VFHDILEVFLTLSSKVGAEVELELAEVLKDDGERSDGPLPLLRRVKVEIHELREVRSNELELRMRPMSQLEWMQRQRQKRKEIRRTRAMSPNSRPVPSSSPQGEGLSSLRTFSSCRRVYNQLLSVQALRLSDHIEKAGNETDLNRLLSSSHASELFDGRFFALLLDSEDVSDFGGSFISAEGTGWHLLGDFCEVQGERVVVGGKKGSTQLVGLFFPPPTAIIIRPPSLPFLLSNSESSDGPKLGMEGCS